MIAIRKVWEDAPDANPLLRAVLICLAKLYEGLVRLRVVLYQKGIFRSRQLSCPVISVGNLTAGGTGKTPMTLYLARYLKKNGKKVALVSRGYKGGFEARGGVVSDGHHLLTDVHEAGDEPFMMAQALPDVPIVVGADRHKAGRRAVRDFSPDVIILDDAFQHLKLARDIDLVLVDSSRPFGNGYLLPAGELREPLRALQRADAVIITRADLENKPDKMKPAWKMLAVKTEGHVFTTRHVPKIKRIVSGKSPRSLKNGAGNQGPEMLAGQRVFAFSGVAKNDYFLYMLARLKCRIVGSQEFSDHHAYSPENLQAICQQAQELEADFLVTTEKDLVKIETFTNWPVDLVVMDVDLVFESDEEGFRLLLQRKLRI